MRFPTKIFLSIVAMLTPAAASPDLTDPQWPTAAVPINASEAVVEAFWDPEIAAETRWRFTPIADTGNPTSQHPIIRRWDCIEIGWDTSTSINGVSIERPFNLPLLDYERLVFRLNLSPDCLAKLSVKIDGRWQSSEPPASGDYSAIEVVQAISGRQLEGVRLDITSSKPGPQTMKLRWVMLQKPGATWAAPKIDFEKFLVAPTSPPQPGLGLLFGPAEMNQMRELYLGPLFDQVRAADHKLVESHRTVDPLSHLRPFLLYGSEFMRKRDQPYRRDVDGLLLAMHGLLTRDEDALIRAAQHAIVLAHMDHWADGFMDRFPGSNWTHAGFAPNVGSIHASLLLDWCWDVLTPEGRELIRESIRTKGLPYIKPHLSAMANQGVRFHKGLILGKIASDTTHHPSLKEDIAEDISRMDTKLTPLIREDGTFAEELGYGLGTTTSTLLTYHVAARYLGKPLSAVVNPRIIGGLNFALLQQESLPSPLAAFAAGPLNEDRMAALCVPSQILEASGFSATEMAVFGLDWLWAPKLHATINPHALSPFSIHREGGWIFAGSDQTGSLRLGFESGLWGDEGHNYKHKNALTVSANGMPLLLSRQHVAYADKRYESTAATTAYNTFAPGGRNQEVTLPRITREQIHGPGSAPPSPRGSELLAAADLGRTVVLVADTASAWTDNVEQCKRRVILLRPGVILIEDTALLATPETGVQIWNSLFPWQSTGSDQATITTTQTELKLQVITPAMPSVRLHENSVHRIKNPLSIIPVHAASVTLPAAKQHRVITLITNHPLGATPPSIKHLGPDPAAPIGLQVRQGETIWTFYFAAAELAQTLDLQTDGTWGFITSVSGETTEVGVFSATHLAWQDQTTTGDGFLSLTIVEEP